MTYTQLFDFSLVTLNAIYVMNLLYRRLAFMFCCFYFASLIIAFYIHSELYCIVFIPVPTGDFVFRLPVCLSRHLVRNSYGFQCGETSFPST